MLHCEYAGEQRAVISAGLESFQVYSNGATCKGPHELAVAITIPISELHDFAAQVAAVLEQAKADVSALKAGA